MKNGIAIDKLQSFSVLTIDKDLQSVFNQNLSFEQKLELVSYKIQILKNRKDNNKTLWLTDDTTYFYHALNQKLHN